MRARVVTDSTSDLTLEVAEDLWITVIPAYVRFGEESFRDKVDMTPDEFYERQRLLGEGEAYPTTSTPSSGDFCDAFCRLAETADEIILITVASVQSSVYQTALIGREMAYAKLKGTCRIEVIDSKLGTMAMGLVVIKAAEAALAGESLDGIKRLVQATIPLIETRIMLSTLEYLHRGGRIGGLTAWLGKVLHMRPVLSIKDGYVVPITRLRCARGRFTEKCEGLLLDFLESLPPLESIAVEFTTDREVAKLLERKIRSIYPDAKVYLAQAGPVLGTHAGPNAFEVAALPKQGGE